MSDYSDFLVPAPEPSAADWNETGVVILREGMPNGLLERYENAWLAAHGVDGQFSPDNAGGWQYETPYMHHDEVAELFCYTGLADTLESLLGEPAGVHLNLTGWITTSRNWHQDSYLNPPHVGDYYAAVWIAFHDIHPDSGPFQYIPGSHRWPQVTQETIAQYFDLSDPMWPTKSEEILTPLFEAEIERRQAEIVTYLPKRGDILIWHGRLLHRGSPANVPGTERRATIAHFSGINHRPDMPRAVKRRGGYLFPIQQTLRPGVVR